MAQVNKPKEKSSERFATPDRVWSVAKSKLLGPVRMLRLKWKNKNAEGELVHSGMETVRIFAEDLSCMKYYKAKYNQVTDDELKKMFQLTGIRLQSDCNDKCKAWTTFIGSLEAIKEKDDILVVGMTTVVGIFQHAGSKKTIKVKGEPSPCPYWARTFFFQEFSSRFPGCEIDGDKLETLAPPNNPNNK